MVGEADGLADGLFDGDFDGLADGLFDGEADGLVVGLVDGAVVDTALTPFARKMAARTVYLNSMI